MDELQADFLEGAVYLFVVLTAVYLALAVMSLAQTAHGAEVVIALSREISGR